MGLMIVPDFVYCLSAQIYSFLISGAEAGCYKLLFLDPFASGHLIILPTAGTKRQTGK